MNLSSSSRNSFPTSSDNEISVRRTKYYQVRQNHLEKYGENEFFQRFRITKNTFVMLLSKIEDSIKPATKRGGSIQPKTQLLLTLRFYATGCMQKSVAESTGVSTSSACRIIKRVSEAIAVLHKQYIYMCDKKEEMLNIAEKFYELAKFPRVIGAIDCTLVKISSPGGDEAEAYRTKKQFFAIKVQTVCDSDLNIRNIVARWPGSTDDQTIFDNSNLKRNFEEERFGNYMLVGDSDYQLKPYLMTKLDNVQTPAENIYNESLIRTRNVVVRTNGLWKRRFPVLQLGIRQKLPTILSVIIATAVLHNIAIREKERIPEDWMIIDKNEDMENEGPIDIDIDEDAENIRRLIINQHFSLL